MPQASCVQNVCIYVCTHILLITSILASVIHLDEPTGAFVTMFILNTIISKLGLKIIIVHLSK